MTTVDLATWPRAATYRWFRSFEQPHYAITCQMDASHLMQARAARGISPYRACLYAIGSGVDAVPELRTRFQGDEVTLHNSFEMSMTVPRADGSFGFAYVPFAPGFAVFDKAAAELIDAVRLDGEFTPHSGSGAAVVYLSCLPWLDFTGLDNALPNAEDCIPRIAWGKIVPEGPGHRMAMTIQVHHALVDGVHLGG